MHLSTLERLVPYLASLADLPVVQHPHSHIINLLEKSCELCPVLGAWIYKALYATATTISLLVILFVCALAPESSSTTLPWNVSSYRKALPCLCNVFSPLVSAATSISALPLRLLLPIPLRIELKAEDILQDQHQDRDGHS